MNQLDENFYFAVKDAGLLGLFGWTAQGELLWHVEPTPEQAAQAAALVAAYQPAAPSVSALLAHARRKRWQRETEGLVMPDGTRIPADTDAIARATGALRSLEAGVITGTRFADADGRWCDVPDAATMRAIVDALALFVNRGYVLEAQCADGIRAEPRPSRRWPRSTRFSRPADLSLTP